MPRACTKCGRVVAEAAYCPFCSEPTIVYVPAPVQRNEGSEVRTILTEFQRKKARLIAFVGMILWPTILVGRALTPYAPIVVLVVSLVIGAVYCLALLCALSSTCPCPRCQENLAHLTGQNVRYCPCCGADLAVEIYPKSNELTEFLNKLSGQPGVEITSTDIQIPPGKPAANTDIQIPPGKVEKGTAT